MPAPDSKNVRAGLCRTAGLNDTVLSAVDRTGAEPGSSFAVGTAAQTTIAHARACVLKGADS
jgi:hypothetical protein